ncbi:hypothetical protein JCM3766R1_002244 [Sporobolomyces carnicolor]
MSSSISVAVRVRPFSDKEKALSVNNADPAPPVVFQSHAAAPDPVLSQAQRLGVPSQHRKILKVLDERILVFDPPDSNAVATFQKHHLPLQGKKVKDIRFCFDRVFDDHCGQEEVYEGSAKELVGHVMEGFHSTVFAYGATGCGKTHTISGSPTQPGIVFLIMKDLFSRIAAKSDEVDFSLSVSYLEVYNETIRDLLAPESGILQLRDAPDGTATPAKLSTKEPACAQDVVEWITLGNGNRTVNFTEANATSSRSHAVLRVTVTQKPKAEGLTDSTTSACLSVIDLAGSERASNTKNRGERLTEGANINRSLLALGNCINALCDPRKRGHVPYRDSKLTRLLKQSLGGNCKTVMIVCVSPSSFHYDETHNTLQYANRAKEIKTKAIRNVISVDRHVAQYCQQIMRQTQEIERLRAQLAAQQANAALHDRAEDERAVQAALAKVYAMWETGKLEKMAAAAAAAERAVADKTSTVLAHWQSSVFDAVALNSPSGTSTAAAASTVSLLRQDVQALSNQVKLRLETLRSLADRGAVAMEPFSRVLASTHTHLRASRPSAAPLFAYEVKLLEARLESSVADARGQGGRDGYTHQARLMHKMLEACARVDRALSSAQLDEAPAARALSRLASGIELATVNAFARLAGESPSSFASVSSSGAVAGTKRDSGARSPLVTDNVWDKVARQSTAGVGSLASGPLASPHPKRVKGVQWRDETGDGWELEDVKYNTPDSSNASFPAVTVTSPTSSRMWTTSSTHAPSSDSALAAEMMAAKARSFSATSTLGTHRSPPPSDPSTPFSFLPMDSILSSTAASSSSSSGPCLPPPRSPFLDLANSSLASAVGDPTSFSMAPGSSGLVAPIVAAPQPGGGGSHSLLDVPMALASSSGGGGDSLLLSPGRKARRVSNIGPLRTAKTSRRPSFAAGGTPSSSSSSSLIDANGSIATSAAATVGGAPGAGIRRAGRVVSGPAALPSTMMASSSTSSAPVASLSSSSSRKSPRKLLSNLIGGGGTAATRRLSTHPATTTTTTTPVATTFGQKSAARIAARRASSQAGNNSGSSLNIGGRSIASALGTSKRDSPSSHPPAWR